MYLLGLVKGSGLPPRSTHLLAILACVRDSLQMPFRRQTFVQSIENNEMVKMGLTDDQPAGSYFRKKLVTRRRNRFDNFSFDSLKNRIRCSLEST